MPIFLRWPDPSQPPGDAPAVRVDRKNLPIQRVHQDTARNFFAHTGQRQQKRFCLLVAHRAQRFEVWRAEPRHDSVQQIADRFGFLVGQPTSCDGPGNVFGGRFGDLEVCGEGFFQRPKRIPVARPPSSSP